MSGSENAAWAPGYDAPALLRQGRRARIIRATRSTSGADVVLKVLPEPLGRAELNHLRELSGVSGVVPLLDAGTTADGDLFVVLPFYADGSFGDMLARRGPAPVQEAAAVARSVAAALGSMHGRGLLHNDVCPGNVLRAGRTPVLTGFGSVHRTGEAAPPPGAGTESFLHSPPEALRGEPRTPASDVYRLASTIWTMLVGHTPFSATDGSPFDPGAYAERVLAQDPKPVPRSDISRKLRGVLNRALAKLPEERYQTPAAFASAFEQARTSRPATTLAGATGGQNPLSGAQEPLSGAQTPMAGRQHSPVQGTAPASGPQRPPAPPPPSEPAPRDAAPGTREPVSGAQPPMTAPRFPPPPYSVRADRAGEAPSPGTGPQASAAAPTGPRPADAPFPQAPPSGPQSPPATAWFPSSGPQASHGDPPAAPRGGPQAPPRGPHLPAEPAEHPPTGPRPSPERRPAPHAEHPDPPGRPTGLEGSRLPATDAGGTAEIMMAKLRGEEISALRAWSRLEGWTGTAESSFLPVDEGPAAEDGAPVWGLPPEPAQGRARWRRHLHIAVTVCGILLVTSVSSVFAATGSRTPVVAAAEEEAAPEPVAEEEQPAEQVVEPAVPPQVPAPSGVLLADNLGAVELTWTDNSGGTASFFVLGGPSGHDPLTVARTGPGVVSAQVVTDDTVMEYCFTVVAVEESAAAAEEVCTTRAADREAERQAEEEAAEEAAEEEEAEEEEEEADPSEAPSPPAGD